MQVVPESVSAPAGANLPMTTSLASPESPYSVHKVIRRNGSVVGFEPSKISIAMTKAFIGANGGTGAASARVREQVVKLTENVVSALIQREPTGGTFHIEDIQDQVELALMSDGEHNVARAYVFYREERANQPGKERENQQPRQQSTLNVTEGGILKPLDLVRITALVREACEGLGREVSPEPVLAAMQRDLYEGVPMEEVRKSLILA